MEIAQVSIHMLACDIKYVRFDIRGLSPGSSEDEAGIKEAAELCENIVMVTALILCNIDQVLSTNYCTMLCRSRLCYDKPSVFDVDVPLLYICEFLHDN